MSRVQHNWAHNCQNWEPYVSHAWISREYYTHVFISFIKWQILDEKRRSRILYIVSLLFINDR